jgi:hypothetical protein
MTGPTHYNCPHCMYAYQSGDPRFAVPEGKASRDMACPACHGAIRVWAPGRSPSERKSVWPWIVLAIITVVVVVYLRS